MFLIYNFDYYIKNLHEIFYIWNGGMSFHGGLIGIIVTTIIFTSIKKIPTFIYLDIISCVAPIWIIFWAEFQILLMENYMVK